MAHLKNYAEQMGGFDYTFTQRYNFSHLETKCLVKKMESNQSHTKKQEPPS